MDVSEAELKQLRKLFASIDEDGSGLLDRDEVHLLAEELGVELSAPELDQAMREMDEDGSGEVDFEEFTEWFGRAKESAGSKWANAVKKKTKAMTKHKDAEVLEPPALDSPLRTLLGFEHRDMKFKRRELVTKGLPAVDSMLRHLESKSGSSEDEDGSSTKRRRRRRVIRRSRHALFDTTHRNGRAKTPGRLTPEDVYHNSLGWDDKQSMRGAGNVRSGASDMSMRSFDTVDAFSDQESDSDTERINREALHLYLK